MSPACDLVIGWLIFILLTFKHAACYTLKYLTGYIMKTKILNVIKEKFLKAKITHLIFFLIFWTVLLSARFLVTIDLHCFILPAFSCLSFAAHWVSGWKPFAKNIKKIKSIILLKILVVPAQLCFLKIFFDKYSMFTCI